MYLIQGTKNITSEDTRFNFRLYSSTNFIVYKRYKFDDESRGFWSYLFFSEEN